MLERDLQRKILAQLTREDILAFKITAPAKNGVPDILAIIDGFAVFVEVKLPHNRPTPLQVRQIQQIRANGAFADVCTSLDDLQKFLGEVRENIRERRENANQHKTL